VVSRNLGGAAAKFFSRIVRDGDLVGLTWGLTLSDMGDQLPNEKKRNITIYQMIGGLGEPFSETHATDLVRRIAIATGANLRLLHAPGIVSTLETARLLRSEPYIAQALEMMNKVDIAFAGIGAPTEHSLLMREEKIIKWAEIKRLTAMGAVGEIGLQFYDIHGNLIHSELDERVIGISLQSMRQLGRVVGVAGGSEKFEAILGALRGGYINTLITDTATAQKLLKAEE
jgi:deoxyribonucleoside regulator